MFIVFRWTMSALAYPRVNTRIWRRIHTHALAAMQRKWPKLGAHTQRPSKADTHKDTLEVKDMHTRWAQGVDKAPWSGHVNTDLFR